MNKLTGLLLCLLSLQVVNAVESDPQQLIRQTADQVLLKIQSNSEQYKQDPTKLYALVDEVVLPHFDFDTMVDLALGRNKNKVNAQQKPLIIKEFRVLLNYSLKASKEGWKVYDISVDDISLVTNYRSSFARQIKKKGVDGLIKTLHDRNQEL